MPCAEIERYQFTAFSERDFMRTGAFLILCGLLISGGVQAQQSAIPESSKKQPIRMLSAKQIADGWIQLFDGTTDYGWKPRGDAQWTVTDGAVVSEAGKAGSLCTTTEFGDGILHVECSYASLIGAIALGTPPQVEADPQKAVPFYFFSTDLKKIKRPSNRNSASTWIPYDFVVTGKDVEVRSDGAVVGHYKSQSPIRGTIALVTIGKGAIRFRNILFRPTGLKRVFNGKDLAGWIAPEGNKSVFSVTEEGWLNLKGGRGDLQTTGQWGDFVLQIEVYTNGDHLNSGVFFRAEAGKFEQGYEDQIRNQWEGDDRTKPVDYGTGAVYNRMPVRRVVSSDREWFTMTLVAHGTHIASWVNGVLVCDFTDTRPPDQFNARKGARTTAGVISLQGHEPDTDLNFRNIRIAELPTVAKWTILK